MELLLLHLIFLHYMVCSVLILSYTQKIYLLLSCRYLFWNQWQYYFNFYRIIVPIFLQIMHWHNNMKIFCIVYECIIYIWYAWSKWSNVRAICRVNRMRTRLFRKTTPKLLQRGSLSTIDWDGLTLG